MWSLEGTVVVELVSSVVGLALIVLFLAALIAYAILMLIIQAITAVAGFFYNTFRKVGIL